jgi:transposase
MDDTSEQIEPAAAYRRSLVLTTFRACGSGHRSASQCTQGASDRKALADKQPLPIWVMRTGITNAIYYKAISGNKHKALIDKTKLQTPSAQSRDTWLHHYLHILVHEQFTIFVLDCFLLLLGRILQACMDVGLHLRLGYLQILVHEQFTIFVLD